MFTDIMKEFKSRKENNTTITDILNMFWLEKSIGKEFSEENLEEDFPLYFDHPQDPYYF